MKTTFAGILVAVLLVSCGRERDRGAVDSGGLPDAGDAGRDDGGALSDASADGAPPDSGCDGLVKETLGEDVCYGYCDDYGGYMIPDVPECELWCERYEGCGPTELAAECVACTDEACAAQKTELFAMDAASCPADCKQCVVDAPAMACSHCLAQCDGYRACREALGRYQSCVSLFCAGECGIRCI